jgi:hypothetical protein
MVYSKQDNSTTGVYPMAELFCTIIVFLLLPSAILLGIYGIITLIALINRQD